MQDDEQRPQPDKKNSSISLFPYSPPEGEEHTKLPSLFFLGS
jgi:hypothetical protein